MANIGNITLVILLAAQMAGAMAPRQGYTGVNTEAAISMDNN